MSFNFLLIILFLNIIFLLGYNSLTQKLNLFDYPDSSRKLHKEKTSLTGGILFFLCVIIYFIFNFFFLTENHLSLKENFSLVLILITFFLTGLYDDKYNLNPNIKLFLTIFFSLSLILFNESFSVNDLNFSFTDKSISLGNFSIMFTLICILCFVNACNMFDGIDLQFGFYLIFLSIFFLTKGFMSNIFFGFLICSIIFFILNYKKKIFIGNNGTLFLGSFFSFAFINAYSEGYIRNVDEIFIIMAIPGFDLIRVSISRLTKGQHMFEPDRLHIHHILLNKTGLLFTNLLIQTNILLPVIFFYLFKNFFISFALSLFIYLMLLFWSKK